MYLAICQANTRRSPNVDSMLVHPLRRCPNIKSTLSERFVFAGHIAVYYANLILLPCRVNRSQQKSMHAVIG